MVPSGLVHVLRTSLTTMAQVSVKENLQLVYHRMYEAHRNRTLVSKEWSLEPKLVAVSKKQPKEAIIEAYQAGQRYFGENYVQELIDKATDEQILQLCPEIKWHFIGHLQRNKVQKLVNIGYSLHMVQTVDSENLAKTLNDALAKFHGEGPKMQVLIQVNTSSEEGKSGVLPSEVLKLARYIHSCKWLRFVGLMTIGSLEASKAEDQNKDFEKLVELRNLVSEDLKLSECELSMGMSMDFEHAVMMGSTIVRIGSAIFGERVSQ